MPSYRTQALIPTQFGLPKNQIKHIASRSYHSFAIDKAGKVYAWGLSNFGQTGLPGGAGEDDSLVLKPKVVQKLEGWEIEDVQGGTHHSVALTGEGEVLVWGRCDDGQMGVELDDILEEELMYDERKKPRILLKPTVVPGMST